MAKQIPCPDCGRKVSPSNLSRHRRARHMPKPRPKPYGKKFTQPSLPITIGSEDDRRYDEIAPRGEGPERFRVYRLRTGELQLIATTGTPQGFGLALFTLWQEGEFETDDSAGVLDTLEDPGHWVVHPWALGRRRPAPKEMAA